MPQKSPPYTTRNYHGIYLFQYRFPKRIRETCPSLQVLFRRSLHTRCKREAAVRSRRWWVIMDELAKRFFHDPVAYARAVELLSRYEAVEHLDWQSVEDYLSGLDEGETELLDTALSHRKMRQVQHTHQALLEKVALLEKTVEALITAANTPEISKWKSSAAPEASHSPRSLAPPPAMDLPPQQSSEWKQGRSIRQNSDRTQPQPTVTDFRLVRAKSYGLFGIRFESFLPNGAVCPRIYPSMNCYG